MNRTSAITWLKRITLVGIYGGLLVPLVFVPVVIFPFVFSKLIYFQVLIGLTFPAYLALAWAEPKYRPRWTALYVAIVAYFAALGLSVIFASDVSRAWWGNQERMNGLFTLLHFFAWFTMTASVIKTWDGWKKLLMFEVVISALMAVVAILQKPFPSLLLFPVQGRIGGLLDNPIYMGAYQIFNLFFILLLWLRGSSRNVKIWLAVFAALDTIAFILAQSRGPLLGLAVGIVLFAVAFAAMTPSKKTRTYVFGPVVLMLVLYGALFALRNTDPIKNSTLARFTNFSETTGTRFIAWNIAWEGFLERPLTGWGLDDFHILFNQKYNPVSLEYGYYETWFDRAHNVVMDALAMTGIFGTLTFFGVFGALFYSVYRSHKNGYIDAVTASICYALPVAYFVQNLFVFDQPAGFTMSYFLYAFIVAASLPGFSVKSGEATEAGTGRSVSWAVFGVVQFLALVVVWRTSVLPAQASYLSIKSNNYFSSGYLNEALSLAKEAATIPTPYLDEQTFLQSRNLISLLDSGNLQKYPQWREWHDLVKNLNEKYSAAHPTNTNPLFVYARFLDAFGSIIPDDMKDAEHVYLAAIASSPKRQQIYFSAARYYIEIGNKQKGYELLKQAEDFDPNIGEAHWYVGVSLVYDLGRKEDGAKEIVAAMNTKNPYSLKNVRDALTLAYAYETLNDANGFLSLLPQLPALGGGDIQMFLEFARIAERMGLAQPRDVILRAIVKAQPSIEMRLAPVLNGSATSIDASLKQTESLQVTATSTAPAAKEGAGTGPRR